MQATEVYTIIDCPHCNVLFAITQKFEQRMRERETTFYCPRGHGMSYGDTIADRLKAAQELAARRLADLDQVRAQRDELELSRRAVKGQLTKVKNRVAKGVCPCCNRSFSDLAAHMETKHPTYAAG